MNVKRSCFIISALLLLSGCSSVPKQSVVHYDMAPLMSQSGRFVSYVRTTWKNGRMNEASLMAQDRYSAQEYAVGGDMNDCIWHPLERTFYYLSGDALFEVDPEKLTKKQVFILKQPPYGSLTLYGWQDGKTLVMRQSIPEINPSGSYCLLFDVESKVYIGRYFLADAGWAQVPTGDQYKLAETTNKKVRLLCDGKRLHGKLDPKKLAKAQDGYSLQIEYGSVWYELPLMATGDFSRNKHFWDYDKDRLFFSSRNYFWRVDLPDGQLTRIGLSDKIHEGLMQEWRSATRQSPALCRAPMLPPSADATDTVLVAFDADRSSAITGRAYFLKNELWVSANGQAVTVNVDRATEVLSIRDPHAYASFSKRGDTVLYSYKGSIGAFSGFLSLLTQGPIVPSSSQFVP